MSIDIPEDTLKQWCEEGRDNLRENGYYSNSEECAYMNGYLAAKTSSYERELKKEIEIRDLLKFIELGHLHSEDKEAFEKILAIENLLSNDSKDKRYKFMDEMEKLQERIKELEAEIVVVKSQKIRELMSGADAELEKRDQLIEQVYPWIKDPSAIPFVRVRLQWIKQIEELKGEK